MALPQALSFESGEIKHRIWHWPSRQPEISTIVALHGFTGSGQDFAAVADKRNEMTAWYAPDFLGHGQSDSPHDIKHYTIESFADYFDVMLAVLNITRPIILGYSMGGRAAIHYTITKPDDVRALVLIGATAGIADSSVREIRRKEDDKLAHHILSDDIELFARKWETKPIIATQKYIPEPYRKAVMERRRKNKRSGLAKNLRAMGTGAMNPVWDNLKMITCPTLLITGETDHKFTRIAVEMEKQIASAEHSVIPDTGHAAHLESPEIVAEKLHAFLNEAP